MRRPSSLAVVIVGLVSTVSITSADPLGPAFDLSVGGGVYVGDIGDHDGGATPHLRIGGGLARGGWAVLVSAEMPSVFELQELNARPNFLGVGVGPSVRRELTTGAGLRVHVRVGYAWRWLQGDYEVRRLCDYHGGCAGGFWTERPVYTAHGPTIAIGLGGRFPSRGIWAAIGLELHASHVTIDRLGREPDLGGAYLGLGVNAAIGRGAD